MRRGFVTLTDGSRQVHFRRAGSGPPLVVLHATPDSSLAMESFSAELAAHGRTVFALDTPGYGESDSLPALDPSMDDYVNALSSTLEALGLERAAVLGRGSGATLAVAFAVRHPQRAVSLELEDPLSGPPEERAWMQSNSAPSLAPEWDGSHLLRAWMIRHDMHLFHPWFVRTPATRLRSGLPSPEELQREVLDLLRAGQRWGDADRAALRFDLPAALAHGRVPMAGQFADRPGDRFAAPAPVQPPVVRKPSGFTREYVNVSFGQVHLRRGGAAGVPVLMLHASPSSSRTVLPLAELLANDRPVIAMDTPGFGESDPLTAPDPSIADFADAVLEVVHALNDGPVDLYGTHTGALIALEAAVRGPQHVRRVVFDGLPVFSPQESADHLANYVPSFEPRWDGSHVVWAWNFIRNMTLFYPWYHQDVEHTTGRAPSTPMLHERVVDLMKAGPRYALGYRAAYRYSTRQALARLAVPALVCVSPEDVLAHHAEAVRQQRPDITITSLDPAVRLAATQAAMGSFLDSSD